MTLLHCPRVLGGESRQGHAVTHACSSLWKSMQSSQGQIHLTERNTKALSAKPHPCSLPRTCWLAGSCFFQVVEGLVEVTQVVKCHSRSIERLEVLAFLLQHFEAVLLDPLVIHQLGLEQAGCRPWGGWQTDRQENISAGVSPALAMCTGEQLRWGKWLSPVIQKGIVCQTRLFVI